jgi:carbon monoxide dehydrogenase subunit G
LYRIEESVRIDRPPEQVWASIADYSFDLRWRRGITEMTPDPPGPPQPGSRIHEILKLAGRRYTTDSTVTDVEPGVSYSFAGAGTSGDVRGGRTVMPDPGGDGSVFTYTIEVKPKGTARALGPLLLPLLRSGLQKDLKRLKALLEAA